MQRGCKVGYEAIGVVMLVVRIVTGDGRGELCRTFGTDVVTAGTVADVA